MSAVTSPATRSSAASSAFRPMTHQGQETSETKSIRMRLLIGYPASAFNSISSFEYPGHNGKADTKEREGHGQTHSHAHIRRLIKAPAKTADQIHDRIEQTE